jgi:FkbM family methyltransferase
VATVGWYAQHGEDRVLSAMFPSASGVFVEVGAADGVEGSNTLHFEQRGWDGILVEANPHFAALCRNARRSVVVECAVTAPGAPDRLPFQIVRNIPQLSGLALDAETLRRYGVDDLETVWVPSSTLDAVLFEHLGNRAVDFVTIDVEGHEWEVMQGFSIDVWKPTVVIIERNYQPDWRIFRHMHAHGYGYTRTTGVNDWFERGVNQTNAQLVRAVLPLYGLGLRRLVKNGLARAHLLELASKVRRRLGGRNHPQRD